MVNNDKNTLHVHLYSNKESLNESLIFVGHATRENPPQEGEFKLKKFDSFQIKMLPTTGDFKDGEIHQIVVSYVNNPSDFYIQLVRYNKLTFFVFLKMFFLQRHNRKFMHNLESLLATEYKKVDKRNCIFKPERGKNINLFLWYF